VVKAVQGSKSKVEVRTPRQTVDAGNILQLLGLGATQGTELVFSAHGPDAEEVLDQLDDLFTNQFGLCGDPN
jgi:phosphotransferase system HPr (HPr) family protein